LLAHSSNDCSASDTVFVVVEPLPVVSAGRDTTIYIGSKLMLFASGAESYKWNEDVSINDTSIFNPTVNPKVKTTYIVTGRTMYGCLGTDTVVIDVKYPTTIRVPNIITPNNDGHNDVWDLTSVPGIDNSKVVILDRWGSLIYESDKAGYDHKWNGTRLDLEYPEGTYYYIIDLYDFKETVKGALLLVR
jgi:gliding motility-associated-like protein